MVACLGNHEVNGGYGKARDKAPLFLSLFDGLYADATYAALDFGDYLSLVLLDSGHVAPIGGEQAHWLDTTLRDRTLRPHLMVANHVPAYPSFRPPVVPGKDAKAGTGDANRSHWVPLFERHNVDAVLEHTTTRSSGRTRCSAGTGTRTGRVPRGRVVGAVAGAEGPGNPVVPRGRRGGVPLHRAPAGARPGGSTWRSRSPARWPTCA